MMNALKGYSISLQTTRRELPYQFQLLPNGKMTIGNPRGQVLVVSKLQVENILKRDDLDFHRREMYETALKEFEHV